MPRRYATYIPEWQIYHQWSTVGAVILGIGFALMLGYLIHSLFAGRKAEANEWGGVTLDWESPTPPNLYNFDDEPVVTGELYDYGHGAKH